ncbi:MAG: hypothetical protein PVI56_11560, partial [Gammaproteobacteria bacterium]
PAQLLLDRCMQVGELDDKLIFRGFGHSEYLCRLLDPSSIPQFICEVKHLSIFTAKADRPRLHGRLGTVQAGRITRGRS